MVKKIILHIVPHLGGGVGSVISGITTTSDNSFVHEVVLLEQPINMAYVNKVKVAGVKLVIEPNIDEIKKLIEESEITLVHWWNHPKTAKLLYNFPVTPTRLILWSHISNLTAPALNPYILLRCTAVWFTSPASYEAEIYKGRLMKRIKEKARVVYGCAGFDAFSEIKHKKHDGFNIGYLGYVDFSKLHPEFISFCKEVRIPEAKFILAGDAPVEEILKRQISEQGISNEFIFKGYVTNVSEVLSDFDVFGYPLMPYHTCTTENAILEAMAAKVPPILLNQLSEKYIIRDGVTGILVSNKEEYGNAIRYLYSNPAKRKAMGIKAHEYVVREYNKMRILKCFYSNIESIMKLPKQVVNFRDIMGDTPAEWFMSCIGKDESKFAKSFLAGINGQSQEIKRLILSCSSLLKGDNKSSVFHYSREFPEDPMLRSWSDTIKEDNLLNG